MDAWRADSLDARERAPGRWAYATVWFPGVQLDRDVPRRGRHTGHVVHGGDVEALRRAALQRSRSHLRLVRNEPHFGALDDDGDSLREVTLDDGTSPRRKSQADRLLRLQTRAALFASPTTPCSAQEVADVLGMRDSEVRALQPTDLRRYGRSLKAPFGAWIAALHEDAPAEVAPRRRHRATAPRLQALGGPKRR